MKISACLVIRNEEKLLARCLQSLRGVIDEIIVIHDGPCNDRSLTIAKKYSAKIFTRPFIGEAEYHRPFSYQQANGEWILQIDADELLSERAKRKIPHLIKQSTIDAYSFFWPYFINGHYLTKGPFAHTFKPCLFRKNKMFMVGISHEYPRTYGILVKRPDCHLEHQPVTDHYSKNIYINKWVQWAKIQSKQIYNLDKAPFFNIDNFASNPVYQYYQYFRRFPLVSAITETIKFLLIYLSRGILLSDFLSWKIAFFELRYLWLVRIYLLKMKHGKQV